MTCDQIAEALAAAPSGHPPSIDPTDILDRQRQIPIDVQAMRAMIERHNDPEYYKKWRIADPAEFLRSWEETAREMHDTFRAHNEATSQALARADRTKSAAHVAKSPRVATGQLFFPEP